MRLQELYKKTTDYKQAVLRVGLPVIALYRLTDFLIYWTMKGNRAGLHYPLPWRVALGMDVVTILIISTVWWEVARSVVGKHPRADKE
jgi:hypothetical protein